MTKPKAMTNQCYRVGSRQRIKGISPRWIGFSEDDGCVIAEGADIRRQRRSFSQRVGDNTFHLCVSYVGQIPAFRRQRAAPFGIRN